MPVYGTWAAWSVVLGDSLHKLSARRAQQPRYIPDQEGAIESISGQSRSDLPPTTSRASGGCLLADRVFEQRHRNAQRLRGDDPSRG